MSQICRSGAASAYPGRAGRAPSPAARPHRSCGEEFAWLPPEKDRERECRERGDPGVVAIDLVVVELATVRDHRFQALDLGLEVEHVLFDVSSG